jgi:D-alanyl-D-alanine dipeptidase
LRLAAQDAAAALEQAVAWLARQRPGYRLLILDALRPQRVQEQLWQTLQGTDLLGYIAEPVRGSIHSFGMALDLTIVDQAGAGAGYGHGFR